MANEFFTILTATGRNKLANATATATPLNLTQMAVGDGDNGAYYSPTEAQTALKHEVWRGAINHLAVDANNPNWIVAELVIPDDVGGFYIREVGLFDSTGAMIAVGKFPESYKPTLAAGSNKQLYVRMILEVANTSAVTLLVDPSVVLATRQYCDDKVASEINKLDGKQSVLVATTAAIALTGLQTIDGVVLAAGDRVLVKDQAQAKDNGIYVVSAGVWVRAADADAAIEVTPGLFVSVEKGTANADSIWQLVTDAPITLGVTALLWEMVSGKAGITAGTYRQVTVDQRGRVTGGTNPTTRAGYGLTDAAASGANSDITELNAVTKGSVFRKNIAVNGGFDIWNDGTTIAGITNVPKYTAECWFGYRNAVVAGMTVSRQAATGAGWYALRAQRDAGNANTACIGIGQVIESSVAKRCAGKKLTVSFSAKAGANFSAAGSQLPVILYIGQGADQSSTLMVAGTWTGTSALTSNITISPVQARYAATFDVPANATQLGIAFAPQTVGVAGANDWYELEDVQVELGAVATDFEVLRLQQIIADTQRFYERSYDLGTSAGAITANGAPSLTISGANVERLAVPFKVTKRATPAVTIYSPGSGLSGKVYCNGSDQNGSASSIGTNGFQISNTGTIYRDLTAHFVADARF